MEDIDNNNENVQPKLKTYKDIKRKYYQWYKSNVPDFNKNLNQYYKERRNQKKLLNIESILNNFDEHYKKIQEEKAIKSGNYKILSEYDKLKLKYEKQKQKILKSDNVSK